MISSREITKDAECQVNEDLVTSIQEEIDSSIGDTTRLEFILAKIKKGTSLYECDRKYLTQRLLDSAHGKAHDTAYNQEQMVEGTVPRRITDEVNNHGNVSELTSTGLRNSLIHQPDNNSEEVRKHTKTMEQMRRDLHQTLRRIDRLEGNIQEEKYREPIVRAKYGNDFMYLKNQDEDHIGLKPKKILETRKGMTDKPILHKFVRVLLVVTVVTITTFFAIVALFNIPIARAWLEDYGITYDEIKTLVNWLLPILVIILANWSICAYMFLVETRKNK